jgi:hypothetical protein
MLLIHWAEANRNAYSFNQNCPGMYKPGLGCDQEEARVHCATMKCQEPLSPLSASAGQMTLTPSHNPCFCSHHCDQCTVKQSPASLARVHPCACNLPLLPHLKAAGHSRGHRLHDTSREWRAITARHHVIVQQTVYFTSPTMISQSTLRPRAVMHKQALLLAAAPAAE